MRSPRPCARAGGAAAHEAGGVALLTLMGSAVMLMAGVLIVVAATDAVVSHARASSAADAAALAAVATSPLTGGDGDAREAAHRLATGNGATLERIDEEGWPLAVRVEVSVATHSAFVQPLLPAVHAESAAALVPEDP